jgi:YesN/AraC family two-component response regulator
MPNHDKLCKNKKEKCCCKKIVANKKNVGAKWANYLDKCKVLDPCKKTRPTTQTLFRNESKKMAQSYIAQHSHRGWRKVSWSRFQLEKKTKTFQNKTIGKTDLFHTTVTRCKKTNDNLTLDQLQKDIEDKEEEINSLLEKQQQLNEKVEVPEKGNNYINYETIENIIIG